MNRPALLKRPEARVAKDDQSRAPSPLTREEFLTRWRTEGARLNHIGALVDPAKLVEEVLRDAETLFDSEENELLTLTEAAKISGYTADHLGRQVRRGILKNFGRPNAPRIRRAELPRKLNALPGADADPDLVGASKRRVAQAISTSGSRR